MIEINNNLTKLNEITSWLCSEGYPTTLFDDVRAWSSTPRSLMTDVTPNRLTMWAAKGTSSMLCNESGYYVYPIRTFNKDTVGLGKMSKPKEDENNNSSSNTTDENEEEVITQTYIGTKAPDAKKNVGDIVFTDGSATPYSVFNSYAQETIDEKKSSAIAVIFYAGTSVSDPLGKKTLGVGLKQQWVGTGSDTWLKWCSSDAKANNKNISIIRCTPDSQSTPAGTATFVNAVDIDGSDNLSQIADFLGADDDTVGENASQRYPAFYFAINYKDQTSGHVKDTDFENGWYLPTCAELCHIYKVKSTVNNSLSVCGGNIFKTGTFWSSSQYGSAGNQALCVNFGDGSWPGYTKSGSHGNYACAIRSF